MTKGKIRGIVKRAKERIDSAGCTSVDGIARHYVEMLQELNEEAAAMEVYKHYEKVWG